MRGTLVGTPKQTVLFIADEASQLHLCFISANTAHSQVVEYASLHISSSVVFSFSSQIKQKEQLEK